MMRSASYFAALFVLSLAIGCAKDMAPDAQILTQDSGPENGMCFIELPDGGLQDAGWCVDAGPAAGTCYVVLPDGGVLLLDAGMCDAG